MRRALLAEVVRRVAEPGVGIFHRVAGALRLGEGAVLPPAVLDRAAADPGPGHHGVPQRYAEGPRLHLLHASAAEATEATAVSQSHRAEDAPAAAALLAVARRNVPQALQDILDAVLNLKVGRGEERQIVCKNRRRQRIV